LLPTALQGGQDMEEDEEMQAQGSQNGGGRSRSKRSQAGTRQEG
jgi:hypothetical protein